MTKTIAWIFRKIPQWECSAGVFILKANFERFTSNSLIQGVIQQSALVLSFPALPCVLLLVACFAEKRLLVFLDYLLYVSFFLCCFFFGSQCTPLDPSCSHGTTGRHWQEGDSPSDAGPDGGRMGRKWKCHHWQCSWAIYRGKKRRPRLGSWSPSLFASRVIHNRSGMINETQVSLAVQSFSSSGDRGLRKIFVITCLLHNVEQPMIRLSAVFILSCSAQGHSGYRGWYSMKYWS